MTSVQRTTSSELLTNEYAAKLLRLPELPLHVWPAIEGKSPRTFFAQLTGISLSRFRKDSVPIFRKSTQERAYTHVKKVLSDKMLQNGWSELEINEHFANSPSALEGSARSYADLIYGLQMPTHLLFPLAINFAKDADALLERLILAFKADDLDEFKRLILGCDWGGEGSTEEKEVAETFSNASTWEEVLPHSMQFFENFFFALAAAVDVEFGARYFEDFKARPLFLLLIPKLIDDVDLSSSTFSKRNLIRKPIRRLLEFLHAMLAQRAVDESCEKPVGRKRLGELLAISDSSVGNLYDGTRHMNLQFFLTVWTQLCNRLCKGKVITPPLTLFVAACGFQQLFVELYPNQKLKSCHLIDEDTYRSYWNWHRERWADHFSEGSEEWPAWMN